MFLPNGLSDFLKNWLAQNSEALAEDSTTDGQPGWGGWYFSVFSSDNLDWKDEGVMLDLKSDQVAWADGNAWAPCIEENGGWKV